MSLSTSAPSNRSSKTPARGRQTQIWPTRTQIGPHSPQHTADDAALRYSGRRATRVATTAVDPAEEVRGRRLGALASPTAAHRPGRRAAVAEDPRARGRSARRHRLPRGLCPAAAPDGGERRGGGLRWEVASLCRPPGATRAPRVVEELSKRFGGHDGIGLCSSVCIPSLP
jgi:hypothetical protein